MQSQKGGEEMLDNGLIRGHAYTITDLRTVCSIYRYRYINIIIFLRDKLNQITNFKSVYSLYLIIIVRVTLKLSTGLNEIST